MEITSVNNDLVKQTVKLQQKKYRSEKFLLEGFKAIKEAFLFGLEFEYLFVDKDKADNYNFLQDKIILTNETVLKKITTTDTASDAIAVAYKKHYDNAQLKNFKKVILLENIKDLGNLGTIIRTSVAFDIDAIVLYGECADLYNPKCVRASVGNLWKLPIFEIKNFAELKNNFTNFHRIATLPRTNNYLNEFKIKKPYLIMFGSEANGLSQELIDFATDSVKIEMSKDVESLNLSISCAIILYKLSFM